MGEERRSYTIIIGSKEYFSKQVATVLDEREISYADNFVQMVQEHDDWRKRISIEGISRTEKEDFERTNFLIIRNSDYHGIVETAHDRLGVLIEDLTTDDAEIYVHNPTMLLANYLAKQQARNEIALSQDNETYSMPNDFHIFKEGLCSISEKIIGQENAVNEIVRSLWYLSRVQRKKPFVVMLYGNSSIGKTETIRTISKHFFGEKVFEKHLSMFQNVSAENYLFGNYPNRTSIGFELLERESNLVFLDEFDKLNNYFYPVFYTLFDNTLFKDATYQADISGLVVFLTSNYRNIDEMQKHLGFPIYYRIDKFIRFDDFSSSTIRKVTDIEISYYVEGSDGNLNGEEIYACVSPKINATGENARTIKNKVQQEVEQILFEDAMMQNTDDREALTD